jgi:hypothetical protein
MVWWHKEDPTASVGYDFEDTLALGRRMRRWAPVLEEEARIRVTWERRTTVPGLPPEMRLHRPKTYWTIEAPLWEKRDDLFRGGS